MSLYFEEFQQDKKCSQCDGLIPAHSVVLVKRNPGVQIICGEACRLSAGMEMIGVREFDVFKDFKF